MKKWQSIALLIAGTLAVMYGMVYVDVVMRAKEAYEQGEKYWRWTDHPDEYAQYVDQKRDQQKQILQTRLNQGKITKDDFARESELLNFDHDQKLKESTVKYAYIWYQTAVDLFSPPNSKWVQLSREKMPLAKERWKSELRSKNIPFEDYMID